MTFWTDDKKFMWYGFSGYHYQANLSCSLSRKIVAERVRQFYLSRRGLLQNGSTDDHFIFRRGKRPWSWFLPSETRQPQIVDIRLNEQAGMINTVIDYHVTNFGGIVVRPNLFADETSSLQARLYMT